MAITAFELIGTVDVQTGKAEAGLKRLDDKFKQVSTRSRENLANPFKNINSEATQAENAIGRVDRKMREVGKGASLFGSIAGAGLVAGGIAAVTAALGTGGRAVLDYSGRLEQLSIGFTTLLGSSDAATAHLKELEAFANRTPFEFEQVARASQRFHNMGLETKKVIPLLQSVGDAVAAAGGNSEQIDRVTLALAQMAAKGKVSAEEMNQLAESGVGGWRILEQQLGITKGEAFKLAEQGKISADTFIDAFQKFSKVNFGGAMEKQSHTFLGSLSTIKDGLLTTSATAFKPLFDKISQITDRLAQEISNGKPTVESAFTSITEGLIEIAARAGSAAGESLMEAIERKINTPRDWDIVKAFRGEGSIGAIVRGLSGGTDNGMVSPQTGADMARMMKLLGSKRPPSLRDVNPFERNIGGVSSAGGGGGGSRGGGSQRDVLEGLKLSLVDLNAEYRKYDAALLDSAKHSKVAAEKEQILSDLMSSLSTSAKLTVGSMKDVDQAIEKAIGLLPKKAQAAARALVDQTMAQVKANDQTRLAGFYSEKTQELFTRFRDSIDDTRQGTDEYTVAIRELEQALAKEGVTLGQGTRRELEYQAALQRTLKLTRERLVFARQRERFAANDRPSWTDLGSGSTFGGEPGTTERARLATLDNQVNRELMLRRREELRDQMNGLANDVTNIFSRAEEALIKTPGKFADKWKEAFREVGLGFADMMLQMANDLMHSQVLRLLERVAGIDSTSGSESSRSNASINPLGALTDKLLKKLGIGGNNGSMPNAANSEADAHSNSDLINAQQSSTDRILGGQATQTAQLTAAISKGADRIVDGLTPRQEGFLKGLLGAALSGAVAGATGAAISGGGGSGGGTPVVTSTATPTDAPSGGEGTRPRRVGGGRANGGYVAPGETYLIGENRKPELLTMGNRPGWVTPLPNNKPEIHQHFNFNVHAHGADAAESIKKSRRQLERQAAQSLGAAARQLRSA